ncbi:MAG TPA: addiction module protein, partial [Solirubrobacterales bacterium]|nr:addiction module protein [Solirubrobacterales bacterium]
KTEIAEIKEQALRMPPEERAELMESLHISLLEEPLADWQKDLLDERLEYYERNPDDTLSWEEVKAALRRESA